MKKVLHWLDENLEMYICIVLLALFSTILFIQVIMRYIFNNSLSWSEELARYLFIWLVFIGISYGSKQMKHLRIDVFLNIFPKKARPYVLILSDIIVMVFSAIVVYSAYTTVGKYIKTHMASPAIGVPLWMIHSAAIVGYCLTFIRQIQAIIYQYKHVKNPELAVEEKKAAEEDEEVII